MRGGGGGGGGGGEGGGDGAWVLEGNNLELITSIKSTFFYSSQRRCRQSFKSLYSSKEATLAAIAKKDEWSKGWMPKSTKHANVFVNTSQGVLELERKREREKSRGMFVRDQKRHSLSILVELF